jgi:hypothetical protein
MNEKVQQIIEELIALDPSFGAHRTHLEKLLTSMLNAAPQPVIDEKFVRKLRNDLLSEMENKPNIASVWSKFKDNFMKKTLVSASLAVAVLILAVVGLQQSGVLNKKNANNILSFGSDVRITHAADGAFGSLATLTSASGTGGATNATAAPLGADSARSSIPSGMGGGGGMGVSEKMIAPFYEPVTYKYVYKGDELNLPSDKLDVLKKQSPDAGSLAASLNTLGLGLINLDSFPGSKVQSVSFNQDKGYNLYVDLTQGMVSISGYYDVMPMAEGKMCPVDGCPQPEAIKESDIPADDVLISAANAFLAEHGISTDIYGAPEVRNEYRVQNYAQLKASPKSLVYWPEYVDVVYPLKIQNGEVYDEGGSKVGLTVGVSIRTQKVMSVWNLTTQNYEASSYDAETDSARILKIAQAGGMYGYTGEGGKVVEIELGTPTLQYVQMWDYQMNSSQQLLVPSLVFPVTKQPSDGSFYRKSVVVPLTKNILDRNNGVGGPIQTMEGNSTVATPPAATKVK